MDEIINKIQMVINTLDGGFKDMPSTYQNCATLTACVNCLCEARDELKKKEDENNGDTDSE